MLDVFKQQKSFLTRAKERGDIKYQLEFDENGAFVDVVDRNGKSLKNLDYRVYNGVDREMLQLLEEYKEEDFFNISWGESKNRVYLHRHPKLLELLYHKQDSFYYKDTNLSFEPKKARARLLLKDSEKKITITPQILEEATFEFISPEYVLAGKKVLNIDSIGDNYGTFSRFSTSIESDRVEEILSIVATHFQNIDIVYDDYEIVYRDEKKSIKPAIIFEKVTAENELILKVSATIGKLTPQFFNDYNITKVALINEFEKSINIYECDFAEVFENYANIYKNLNSIKRKIKDASFSEEEGLFVVDGEIASEFIFEHLHSLLDSCELYGSEKLKAYKYTAKEPRLNVEFKNRVDFLDRSEVSVDIDGQSFELFEMIDMFKKNSYIPLSNGEKCIINPNYIKRLERIFKKEGKKIRVSFFDLPEIEKIIAQKNQTPFKKSREFYEGFAKLKKSKSNLPTLKNVKLREYQKEGIKWLKYLYDNGFGGCLADDMGLGKTIQTIGLLSLIYPACKAPTLIVMPKSLLVNWQNELKKFAPNLSYYLYYGSDREHKEIKNYNLILSTYAIVRNDIEILKDLEFDTVILDESQNIKNTDSLASKAVMLLSAKHRFALSGTPIENSLFELYSLFRFINSGMFGSISHFKKDYAAPIQTEDSEEVVEILKAKISPFILRRLKADVLKDLPPKQEQVVYVDMDEKQKALYNRQRDYYRAVLEKQIAINGIDGSKFAIFQAFNDLRQIASVPELKSNEEIPSSQIESMFEMLEDIVANHHKVLIFANFLGSLDAIGAKAEELGMEYLMMTGSTRNRQELVDRFQSDKKTSLMLMTLKVGGVGLNLTAADYVFIFDPWWNRATENQAVDRAHRIGQKSTVFSYKMITKGTIEEKILELQELKSDLSDKIISGDDGGLKQISQKELEFLLG